MAFRSSADRRELHGRSPKGTTLRVSDGSANYGVVALGKSGNRCEKGETKQKDCPAQASPPRKDLW